MLYLQSIWHAMAGCSPAKKRIMLDSWAYLDSWVYAVEPPAATLRRSDRWLHGRWNTPSFQGLNQFGRSADLRVRWPIATWRKTLVRLWYLWDLQPVDRLSRKHVCDAFTHVTHVCCANLLPSVSVSPDAPTNSSLDFIQVVIANGSLHASPFVTTYASRIIIQ